MWGGELNVLVNLLITTINRLTHRAAPAPEARGGVCLTPNQIVIAQPSFYTLSPKKKTRRTAILNGGATRAATLRVPILIAILVVHAELTRCGRSLGLRVDGTHSARRARACSNVPHGSRKVGHVGLR